MSAERSYIIRTYQYYKLSSSSTVYTIVVKGLRTFEASRAQTVALITRHCNAAIAYIAIK